MSCWAPQYFCIKAEDKGKKSFDTLEIITYVHVYAYIHIHTYMVYLRRLQNGQDLSPDVEKAAEG